MRGPRATCRDYPPRRGDRLRAVGVVADTLRLIRSGRSADWLISKNPACEAAAREAEEDWGKTTSSERVVGRASADHRCGRRHWAGCKARTRTDEGAILP